MADQMPCEDNCIVLRKILIPRRNLGFGYRYGSLKRKTSPLPSRPAKKIKLSPPKNSVDGEKNKRSDKKKQKDPNQSKEKSKVKQVKKIGKKEAKVSQGDKVAQEHSTSGIQAANLFPVNKSDTVKEKKKKKDKSKSEKENSPPQKGQKDKTKPLMKWKWKTIDEYLSKSTPATQSKDLPLGNEVSDKFIFLTVKEVMDEVIGTVIEKRFNDDLLPTSSSNGNADSSTKSDTIVAQLVESNPDTCSYTNCSTSLDICNCDDICFNSEPLMTRILEENHNYGRSCKDTIANELPALSQTIDTVPDMPIDLSLNKISSNVSNCGASSGTDSLDVSHMNDNSQKEMSCISPSKLCSPTQNWNLGNCERSENTPMCGVSTKNNIDTDVINSLSFQGENVDKNIVSKTNVIEEICTVNTIGIFPKIKLSKKSQNHKTIQNPTTKKRKREDSCPEKNLKDTWNSNARNKKMKKTSPVFKVGTIEKYFSPVMKPTSNLNRIFENLFSKNNIINGKGKAENETSVFPSRSINSNSEMKPLAEISLNDTAITSTVRKIQFSDY